MVRYVIHALALLPFGGADAMPFDDERAIKFAKLAAATYCGNEQKEAVEAWNCGPKCLPEVSNVKMCAGSTTVSIIGNWEAGCVVAFEGSQTFGSFIQDLESVPTHLDYNCSKAWTECWVHSGFLKEWESHRDCVKTNLDMHGCAPGSGKPVKLTGHSLGAAVNLLAMIELTSLRYDVSESYHFGTPRTGNHDFAQYFDTLFEGKHWRVTHAFDPVPQLPPRTLGWEHVEPEAYYKGDVKDGREECSDPNDKTRCAEVNWDVPHDLLHALDHLKYMDVDLDNGVDHGCAFGAADDVVVV